MQHSLFYTFTTVEKQILKSSKWGRPRDDYGDSVAGGPRDQMMGRFGDDHGTSVIRAF